MKFIKLTFCLLIIAGYSASAQVREDILPRSFGIDSALLPAPASIVLTFDIAHAAELDRRNDKLGHMPRFARAIATDIGLANAGTWITLADGDRIWRCSIHAAGALALIPCYDAFSIPPGATLHVYTPQRDEVIGAFTADNNPVSGKYNSGLIHGDECIIEYYEPAAAAGMGAIHISEIGYAYRMVPGRSVSRGFGGSASCEVNVACPEGAGWQDLKNAVVRILVKLGSDYGWCSGTLLNNGKQDCTPYILSADHCYQDEQNNYTAASAADLNLWMFYFNYESPTCTDPASEGALGSHFLTGCSLISASLDNGGDNGSDFVLVRSNSYVPALYHPYYAGWSNVNTPATSGVSMHHPNADIKKISTYTSPLISTHWGPLTFNTHWAVQWAATADGHGVTEPGSSGSPIFDSNKRVVGSLTGGGSSCDSALIYDFYGKFSYDWNGNGTTAGKRLQDWLDPNNQGIELMNGTYGSCPANLGINDIDPALSAISIYPNPSSAIYTLTGTGSAHRLTISDALGRLVMDVAMKGELSKQIDMSGQESGVYFFRFISDAGSATQKVILNKVR